MITHKLRNAKVLITILAIITLVITLGCSQEQTATDDTRAKNESVEQQSSDTSLSKNSKAENKNGDSAFDINVYFPDANGEKLIAAKRQINTAREDKYNAAVQALIDGPTSDKEGIYIMPKGTQLLNIDVSDGIATVNFNKAFKANFPGGSTEELMLVGSIVNTLTDFDDIKGVNFAIEGKKLDILGGHLDLSTPQTRMQNLL